MAFLARIRFLPITIFAATLMLTVKVNDIWTGIGGLLRGGITVADAEAQQGQPKQQPKAGQPKQQTKAGQPKAGQPAPAPAAPDAAKDAKKDDAAAKDRTADRGARFCNNRLAAHPAWRRVHAEDGGG